MSVDRNQTRYIGSSRWENPSLETVIEDRDAFVRVLDFMPDAVVGVAQDGTIRFSNAQADRLFEMARGKLVGTPFETLLPTRFRAEHRRRLTGFFSEPSMRPPGAHTQLYGVRLDGSEFPIEFSISGVRSNREKIALVSLRDISDRALTEQDRIELKQELALNQSRRLESIGALAGGIAHDFNNLLGAIINYAELAAEAVDDPAVKDDIEQIESSALRAADLTRQLLVFSRRDAVRSVPVELNVLLKNLEKLLRRTIGEQIELHTNFSPDLWTVVADPGQLEQIVLNLAVNSRDAMPEGGLLRISSSNAVMEDMHSPANPEVPPAGDYVRLTVSDSGTGMTPEVVDRAFEPFFTTKRETGGTGLGLSTVYGIVKQAGGYISVESAVGAGTTMSILFPASEAPLIEPIEPIPEGTFEGSGAVVLVVEDEQVVRRLVERVLTENGYRVICRSNAQEALDLIKAGADGLDLLLTDVVMPGMRGSELAQLALEHAPDLAVLLMSGYSDEIVARIDGHEDTFDLVEKPFTRSQLLAAVGDSLLKSHGNPMT